MLKVNLHTEEFYKYRTYRDEERSIEDGTEWVWSRVESPFSSLRVLKAHADAHKGTE